MWHEPPQKWWTNHHINMSGDNSCCNTRNAIAAVPIVVIAAAKAVAPAFATHNRLAAARNTRVRACAVPRLMWVVRSQCSALPSLPLTCRKL